MSVSRIGNSAPNNPATQGLSAAGFTESVRFRGRLVSPSASLLGNAMQGLAAALQTTSGTPFGKDAGPALFRRF